MRAKYYVENLKEETIEKTTCGREVNNKIYLKGRCMRKWIKFIWIVMGSRGRLL
jgi:hypothetical protein